MGKGDYLGGNSIYRPKQRSPIDEAADTAFAMSQKSDLTANQQYIERRSRFILTLLREFPDLTKMKEKQRQQIYQSKRWKRLVADIISK